MRVLVTGGAGYIGAHTALLLAERGDSVVIADDLSTGFQKRVENLPLLRLDLAREDSHETLAKEMRKHEVDSVIHFAARKQVAESMDKPAWYYFQNIGGVSQVLLAMEEAGVNRLVYSSSAAVYGEANGRIDEDHATRPISPYGATKLSGEELVTAAVQAWGLRAASLRYFNVAGAGASDLGDTETLNLVSIVLDHLMAGRPPEIFGDDYDTPDGTCIRDYVHVVDVAEAHLSVLDWLPDEPGNAIMNVGTGVGTSVQEMIAEVLKVSGSALEPVVTNRRPGDAASVVAIVDRVAKSTGWRARLDLADIVKSAWESRGCINSRPKTTV